MFPKVALRDCRLCQKYKFNEESGAMMRQKYATGPDGLGLPVERPKNDKPPCRIASLGCAKGTPEQSYGLSSKNWAAYRFHQRCKATGKWPDDGIVMRNAGIIEAALERAEIDLQWLAIEHQKQIQRMFLEVIKARAI